MTNIEVKNMNKEELTEHYYNFVQSIVFKQFREHLHNYADDLTSQGFILLYEAQEKYDPSKAQFTTYAYTIIYRGLQLYLDNTLIGNKRTVKDKKPYIYRPNPLYLDAIVTDEGDGHGYDIVGFECETENEAMYDELILKIQSRLNELDKPRSIYHRCSEIFPFLLEGYLQKEIAEAIDMSRNTLAGKIAPLKFIIKQVMEEYNNGEKTS